MGYTAEDGEFSVTREQILNLPSLDAVTEHILSLLRDSMTSFDDVTDAIRKDSALSSYLLRSAAVLASGKAWDQLELHNAVKILGLKKIQALTLFHSSHRTYTTPEPDGFSRDEFWKYSLATGLFSELIAKRIGFSQTDQNRVFSAGHLHAVGIGYVDEHFPDQFKTIIRRYRQKNAQLPTIERDVIGYTHGEIGAEIFDAWDLPEVYANVARNYLSPSKEQDPIVDVVHMASNLSKAKGYDIGFEESTLYLEGKVPSRLGLSEQAVRELLRDTFPARFTEFEPR